MVSISINFCMQIADWSSTKVYDSIIAVATLSPSNDQNRLLILFDDEFELESQTIEPATESLECQRNAPPIRDVVINVTN